MSMKKIASKLGILWAVIAIVPIALLVAIFGNAIKLNTDIILAIQMPFLLVQCFALFIIIRYREQVF